MTYVLLARSFHKKLQVASVYATFSYAYWGKFLHIIKPLKEMDSVLSLDVHYLLLQRKNLYL